jgi:hypothetical protein
MLFRSLMLRLSKSGSAAAISSALTSGFSRASVGGNASGAGSNLGNPTSMLKLIESSLG